MHHYTDLQDDHCPTGDALTDPARGLKRFPKHLADPAPAIVKERPAGPTQRRRSLVPHDHGVNEKVLDYNSNHRMQRNLETRA